MTLSDRLNALELKIGKTPVVPLESGIFGKYEGANPAGSVKDRAAFYIVQRAYESGFLDKGIIVEATSGNTGIGLAYVARELGFKCVLTMPESMSEERKKLLAEYGAELVLTPAAEGMAGAVDKAKAICAAKEAFFANQFGNYASVEAHFYTTAPEIFNEIPNVGFIVCCVGSGGTAMGIKKYIDEKRPDCKIVAVEPESSPLLSRGYAGAHKIQGIGANFIPELVKIEKFDEIMTVSDEDAFAAVKEIYKICGFRCGISSGAAYSAAKALRGKLLSETVINDECIKDKYRCEVKNGSIVVILPDNGDRYPQNLYDL